MKDWFLPTLGAILCWGCACFLPKLSTQYISMTSTVVFQGLGGAIISLIIFLHLRYPLETHPKGTIIAVVAGMLTLLGMVFYIKAISKGSVAIISPLSALYPLVVIFLALVVFKETLTLKQLFGIGFALISIILIAE
ncbi:MAG: DMT family transporter [Xenococcaceae cyanobacterium MO_188.B19]|nr:DMT family transporter [Xenococcaceae cyanobacterium MO_188.B19]